MTPDATLLAFSPANDLAAPLLNGITFGSVYGLVALGIVLIYKSNRFFNFAQAEFGTVGGLIGAYCREGKGVFPKLPLVPASILGVAAGVLVAVATERLVIRPLFRASRVTLVVATTGVALLLIQLELLLAGANAAFFAPFRRTTALVTAGATVTSWTDVLIVLALVGTGLGAVAFFRTRYGSAILAVSQEPTAASVVGINVSRISLITWGIAGFAGAVAGVAYAPKLGTVGPGYMTLSGPLIAGFVAAVIGGMTSLPGAFLGGIVLGLVEAFAKTDLLSVDSIPGYSRVVVFVLLLAVLLIRPKGLLGKEV